MLIRTQKNTKYINTLQLLGIAEKTRISSLLLNNIRYLGHFGDNPSYTDTEKDNGTDPLNKEIGTVGLSPFIYSIYIYMILLCFCGYFFRGYTVIPPIPELGYLSDFTVIFHGHKERKYIVDNMVKYGENAWKIWNVVH